MKKCIMVIPTTAVTVTQVTVTQRVRMGNR
jgi:hypothetical protein